MNGICRHCGDYRQLNIYGVCVSCHNELLLHGPLGLGAVQAPAGRAALAAPEPPSPALVNEDGPDDVCERCGFRKPGAEFFEIDGLHTCSDCRANDSAAAYIEMLRGYAEAAEERAQEAERKLAAATEAHRALRKAARALMFVFWPDGDKSDWDHDLTRAGITTKGYAEIDTLAAALAALEAQEGESHE